MKIYLKPAPSVWNWFPRCVAETAGTKGLVRGRNFLWMFWLVCFTK